MDFEAQTITLYNFNISLSLDEARMVLEDPKDFLAALRREVRLAALTPLPDGHKARGLAASVAKKNGAKTARPKHRHSRGESIECPKCGVPFKTQRGLGIHMAKRHAGTPTSVPVAD